jgi:tRNA modification GTPase
VSHHAGTTRDVIEVQLDLGGYPLILADTAGLRESADEVEQEGIRRSARTAEQSDLKLLVLDTSMTKNIPDELRSYLGPDTIVVWNKADLLKNESFSKLPESDSGRIGGEVFLAVKTGEGLADLESLLTRMAEQRLYAGHTPQLTRLRHRHSLEAVLTSITRFVVADSLELAAEDLRLATRSIGQINGTVDVEDILDVVFRDFCIGK